MGGQVKPHGGDLLLKLHGELLFLTLRVTESHSRFSSFWKTEKKTNGFHPLKCFKVAHQWRPEQIKETYE